MPITLVTGLPGHGKTLYTLARWKAEAEKAGRPVWHNDIKGLNIPGWQPIDVKDWANAPAGSLIIVDEAQFAFPVTGRGQTPEWVQKLATHRHLGLDFVVITQDPMLLDSFVRRLVDRHFHIVRNFGFQKATVYEFPNGARENVRANRNDGIRSEWFYPKEVFGWYQSAELHTVKKRLPMRVYLLMAIPFVFLALAGYAYWRLKPENAAARVNGQLVDESKPAGVVGHSGGSGQRDAAPLTPLEYAQAFTPRVAGLPHTAPVYDEVTKPTQAPYPAACVHMPKADKCLCYTQQGTRLDTGAHLCKQIAAGGFFIAWDQPAARAVPVVASVEAKPAAPVVPQGPAMWGFDGERRINPVGKPDGDTIQDGPPSGRARAQGRG